MLLYATHEVCKKNLSWILSFLILSLLFLVSFWGFNNYICTPDRLLFLSECYFWCINFLRAVESELFPCLRRFGMKFYAYNPVSDLLINYFYSFNYKDSRLELK
jgi:hypothetical protein